MRELNERQPYADKLVKLIPTEIVGAYMVINRFIPSANPVTWRIVSTVVAGILCLATALYLRKLGGVRNRAQLVVSTVSFVVWIYSLGGPFKAWGIHFPWLASITLVLWSLFIPLIVSPKAQGGVDQLMMKPEELVRHQEMIGEWKVNVVSYRLGDRYYCNIDNVDPGARIAQGEANSREEAERLAKDEAARQLAQTRRFPV